MEPTHLILIGGGGHALVVASAASAAGLVIDGFVDDSAQSTLARLTSWRHLGVMAEAAAHASTGRILCVGTLAARRRLLAQGDWSRSVTVVHPRAFVDPTAKVGRGVFIGPNAVVQAHATVGDHAIINSGAIIEHECVIGFNAHVAPGAILTGNVSVGPHSMVGAGARVLPGVRIGAEVTVGAGAVVTTDAADGVTLVSAGLRAV